MQCCRAASMLYQFTSLCRADKLQHNKLNRSDVLVLELADVCFEG